MAVLWRALATLGPPTSTALPPQVPPAPSLWKQPLRLYKFQELYVRSVHPEVTEYTSVQLSLLVEWTFFFYYSSSVLEAHAMGYVSRCCCSYHSPVLCTRAEADPGARHMHTSTSVRICLHLFIQSRATSCLAGLILGLNSIHMCAGFVEDYAFSDFRDCGIACAWNPSGTCIAAGSQDGYVVVWDARAHRACAPFCQ